MADRDMNSIKFPGLPDRYKFLRLDPTLTQTGKAADAKEVGDRLASMDDDVSEIAAEGTVPTSEQMLSENVTVDSVPYHFRKTASDNANREELEIVGGSVAWNQRILTRVTADTTGTTCGVDITCRTDGSIVLNNTVTTDGWLSSISGANAYLPMVKKNDTKGHVLMYSFASKHSFLGRQIGDANGGYNCNNSFNAVITKRSADAGEADAVIQIRLISGDAFNNDVVYPTMYDLTAMFGSTIADHIYSLEQATAGAGVALFKSLFPKDYYAYDAGSIQSVSGLSEHITTGFNQWDEEWEVGTVNASTGEKETASNRIRSKNLIPVLPNATYYAEGVVVGTSRGRACFYDANGAFISGLADFPESTIDKTFTTPNNARYMMFSPSYTYGTTYKGDICINRSDPTKNGTYEPYDGHSYALDDSLTLRGIPTLVDGKIKWDGDVYSPSGKVTRRLGIYTVTGNESWAVWGQAYFASVLNPRATDSPTTVNCIADKIIAAPLNGFYDGTSKGVAVRQSNIYIDADAYANRASLTGMTVVYLLATPTTEQADPYIGIQSCDPNGTEEFVSTGIVPVGHNTKYPDNLRMKLDNLPWNFANLIAPTESGYTATRNYTTGALLIVNNVLYKATANIANGGTITPNTNVTATTLAEVIAALS